VSSLNDEMMAGIKKSIDPKNIFAINNTIFRTPEEKEREFAMDEQFNKK